MQNKRHPFSSILYHHSMRKCNAVMLCLSVGLALTGCYRSVTPNFYTLTPKISPLVTSNIQVIEVVPVSLPQRLDTPLMVLQDPNGKSYVLDNQRWTSSLSNELQSGLSAGLQQKLGAIDVYNNGLTGGRVFYSIATEFSRFDIVEHADKSKTEIEVMATWVIKRNDPNTSLTQTTATASQISKSQLNCRMSFKNEVMDSNHDFLNIVHTYQNSLNRVVDAIATATIALDATKKPIIDGVICS